MSFLTLGFFTGLSLILALGAQNIFVIERGLKKQYIFIVCLICSLSDLILIFLGIFLFEYFKIYFTQNVELVFNILLFAFLIYFVISKLRSKNNSFDINLKKNKLSLKNIIIKTLGFTYLNPHVYSDTVLILGNLSKNFILQDKLFFAIGASFASIIYFYSLGYMSSFFSKFIRKQNIWRYINIFIIIFMIILLIYIINDTIQSLDNYFKENTSKTHFTKLFM